MSKPLIYSSFAVFAVCLGSFAARAMASEPLPVLTVAHRAETVGREMKFNVCLPADYPTSTERYPVIYLLHGLTSNYTAWAKMNVPQVAAQYKLIVVMPDVGNTWYVNWADTGDRPNRWEDYIIRELIPHVDATYRTIARREARAINGLSMGGYGALMLGLRHPDLFCSIGSHSGALAFAQNSAESLAKGEQPEYLRREWSNDVNPLIKIAGYSTPAERTPKGKIFATAAECAAHDPFKLVLEVPRAQLPHIYVDCGTDDRLIDSNQRFIRLLLENNIPFTYAQAGGGHVPPYWSREIAQSMAVQNLMLDRAQVAAKKTAKPTPEPAAPAQ